jgi:putative colanic acid biosynthesis acetyltransferase WcaF
MLICGMNLASYSSHNFQRGAGRVREGLWVCVSWILFRLCPFPCYALKRAVLRAFGARVGRGVIIKPGVKITFPWKLCIGDHVWLGEDSWLLNLAPITLEDHVCISQRAFLCTGNHDYTQRTFTLIAKPIHAETGAWVGAATFVSPGLTLGSHSVLTAGSVATKDLLQFGIYQGNPAIKVRDRKIRSEAGGSHPPCRFV